MPTGTSSRAVSRAVRTVLGLALLSAAISARAAEQPAPAADAALRREVESRFDVVPLKDGVALAGRTVDRRIEIDNGVILSQGMPLSGAELRRRFGADADLVLRLSYLDNAALRRVFAPATVPDARPPLSVAAPPTPPGPLTAPDTPAGPAVPPEKPQAAPPVAPTPPVAPSTPGAPDAPPAPSPVFHRTGARIGVAKAIVVAVDEEVTDGVFSLGGAVRIEGRVRDNVVVVGNDLELTATADVRGDLTLVGGELRIAEGARHAGAVHRATGSPWAQLAWPTIGWSWFGPGRSASWLPLAGTTLRILLLGFAMAVLAVVARSRVARIGAAAVASPLRAGLVGVAAQLLFVPALIVLALVLAITIVGLPFVAVLVPLAVLTMLATMLLGFTSLAGRLGDAFTGGPATATNDAVAAALVGLAIIVLPTFLSRLVGIGPDALSVVAMALLVVGTAVEYVAWTVGLGAAILTGLGRWSTVPPPLSPVSGTVMEPSAIL